MPDPASLLADLARTAGIAALATVLARLLAPLAPRHLWALAVPALVPALAVAYAWAALPWPWLHGAAAHQLLHAALAALRLAPLLVAVAWLVPPPPCDRGSVLLARRCAAGGRRAPHPLAIAWLHGPQRRWLAAGLIATPFAAAEFELASRLAVGAWAVRLFDAQAGGQPLAATLLAAAPLAATTALALLAAWRLLRSRGAAAEWPTAPACSAWTVAAAAWLTLVAVPLGLLGWQCWTGRSGGGLAAGLPDELAATLLFSASGAAVALLLARTGPLAAPLAAVGLLGSLTIGLLVLAAAPAASLDGPLPLAAALGLLALPLALAGRRLLHGDPAARLLAARLRAGDPARRRAAAGLRWRLHSGPRFWLAAALAWWCAWDLAAAALLHPTGLTPVPVLLYHLLHYGENAALGGRLALGLAAPLAAIALAWAAARSWDRWRVVHA